MSNTITTVANAGNSILTGGPGQVLSVANGGSGVNPFSFATPKPTGTLTLKSGESGETAEFDAAFINDLKLLLEVIKEVPDDHPLGDLKHDMRMRRAFKKLGG